MAFLSSGSSALRDDRPRWSKWAPRTMYSSRSFGSEPGTIAATFCVGSGSDPEWTADRAVNDCTNLPLQAAFVLPLTGVQIRESLDANAGVSPSDANRRLMYA